ncbi:hydrocephalus-inducing protein-like isoform X1 [Cuculus canorus]|uniref:hydrocephalus-inducing protein-like isoform X1 n=1 Tax=Cuculus canorus TaxID=55661 RepID=UPI0023AAD560|nr:hydrocephalus-inducing protein-like isoform X1 [Cuculus canorus]
MEGTEETGSLQRRQFTQAEPVSVGIEEVFNILPLHGVLLPGESQRVMFTFFGHANIVAGVMALCRVEGGPTYEVALSGEASLINYVLDNAEIDYGLQGFNKVGEAEVTLRNSGKVGFTYAVLSPSVATAGCPRPREPLVLPSTVSVEEEQVLKPGLMSRCPGGAIGKKMGKQTGKEKENSQEVVGEAGS